MDGADVDARVAAASSAFGALHRVFKSKAISLPAKRAAYVACVLAVLLYGSECWAVTAAMRSELDAFHHRCARVMVGINMWHVRHQKITTEWVLGELGLRPVQT